MYCNTFQFPELLFFVPHSKPHCTRGLSKHYHLRFYPKLGMGEFAFLHIPCSCVACTSMLDKPWISVMPLDKQERYKPFTNCTYLPVLGSFNNWNIIQLSHKSTPSDAFNEIHQVDIYGMSDNMASLVKSGKYGSINTTDTTTNGFYVIIFTSDAYTLRDNTTIDGQIITAGELVVKSQYLCSVQAYNNWYCNQHPQQHVITVQTRTILHTILEVNAVPYFHAIPKSVCNMTLSKKSISRHPICFTDSEYDYILEEIGRRYKIGFEINVEVYNDYE